MTTETSAIEGAGRRRSYGERARRGGRTVRHFTIEHDGVTLPVSHGGRGRPLVLCPGLNTTQADLTELTELLRRDHDVVTFDLRGHGLASAADRYSFDAFLSDLVAVMPVRTGNTARARAGRSGGVSRRRRRAGASRW